MRIIVRADSGYFVGALLDLLDAFGHGYLIKVKLKNLVALLARQQWTAITGNPGWEQCTFEYRCGDRKAARCFVAVRKALPKKESPQLDLLETTEYDYFCYVTTEALTPWQAHKKYGELATCETWIEESKGQMGMGKIRTSCFLASAALFHCAVLAYNTLRWMAIMSGNQTLRQWEPETIRTYLVRVAGKLLTGNRQLTVKTPANHLYPQVWDDWVGVGLSPPSGMEVLKNRRAKKNTLPVLVPTARDAWYEKVDGFKAGADDYLGKPFHTEELLTRINALLHRVHQHSGGKLQVGGLKLDEDRQQVITETGEVHELTGYEFKLLRCFLLHLGQVLSKSKLRWMLIELNPSILSHFQATTIRSSAMGR